MIARTWTGEVSAADADAYEAYMNETGVPGYLATPGNQGVFMLRRELGETTEFVMFTLWESEDAIKAFAGDDIEVAIFYPEDERFLVRRDPHAVHYTVARQAGGPSQLG
jgi:heme-degrading monooxygenase HmoA